MAQLTEVQKTQLCVEWKQICKNKEDKYALGTEVFRLLFTKYPHYIRLFKRFRDLPNLDSIMQSAAFKAHAMRFIGAIDAIMENLDDESCLVELLKRLAEEHRPRGITENDFYKTLDVAYDALSPALKSDDARVALRQLFDTALSVIRQSLKEEDEKEREETAKSA
uniref:Globin n=1 Tax=Schistocephalus solidus TaxID=70667 RepID=A0A0X3PJM2_SCHSO